MTTNFRSLGPTRAKRRAVAILTPAMKAVPISLRRTTRFTILYP
jgi:hypothetical protein